MSTHIITDVRGIKDGAQDGLVPTISINCIMKQPGTNNAVVINVTGTNVYDCPSDIADVFLEFACAIRCKKPTKKERNKMSSLIAEIHQR